MHPPPDSFGLKTLLAGLPLQSVQVTSPPSSPAVQVQVQQPPLSIQLYSVVVLVVVLELVEVEVLVLVLVDVLVDVLVEVLVVVVRLIGIRSKLLQTPVDNTLIVVAASGTDVRRYPANIAALDTPVTIGTEYPSASEYKLKGPVSTPAVVNVTNTVCAI
jgi:hypothetical protein